MSETKNMNSVTDDQFDSQVLQTARLALVDFWAEWCGPCRLLTPKLEKIANDYQDKVQVFKMNVDENQKTPARYEIRGIPTLIFFKDGQKVDELVGNHPAEKITSVIEKHLTSA